MSDSGDIQQTLSDAVARNAGIVLSLPSAGLVRHFKSRYLGDCDEGIWIEASEGSAGLLQTLLDNKHPLAISFNAGNRRVSFASTVFKLDPQYRINSQATVSAALIPRPTELKGVQRRTAYRVHVPSETELKVRLWIIPEHAHLNDRPMASQELKVEVRDISLGGVGIRLVPTEGEEPRKLVNEQRLRVQLKYQDIELLFDGRLRTPAQKENEKSPAGIIFKKLESDLEGRQKLAAITRIVGQLHRDEVRRMRLGMVA